MYYPKISSLLILWEYEISEFATEVFLIKLVLIHVGVFSGK